MAAKIIFRRIRGRIIPIRVRKKELKSFVGGGRAESSFLKKQLRRKASGIFGTRKGLTGFFSEGEVFKETSLIPRTRGGLLTVGPAGEIRFRTKKDAKEFLRKFKIPKKKKGDIPF